MNKPLLTREDWVLFLVLIAIPLLFPFLLSPSSWPTHVTITVGTIIALCSLFLSVNTARIQSRSLSQSVSRDQREALFKGLEAYLKIREQRHKAELAGTYSEWFKYYRELFDLQWSEYYIWRERALPDAPYRAWLKQHCRSYQDNETQTLTNAGGPHAANTIGYREVWDRLLGEGYFDREDSFVEHMRKIHAGQIDQALAER